MHINIHEQTEDYLVQLVKRAVARNKKKFSLIATALPFAKLKNTFKARQSRIPAVVGSGREK